MRVLMLAVAALFTSLPVAASSFEYGPQASLFLSLSFAGEPAGAADRSRFGLRLDHDWRQEQLPNPAPLMELSFDRRRFNALTVAGSPIVSRDLILAQNEEGGAVQYVKDHFGWFALGVAGAILVYAVVDGESSKDDRDLDDIDEPGAPQ